MLTNENKWQKVIKAEIHQNAYQIKVSGGGKHLRDGGKHLMYSGKHLRDDA